MRNSEYLQCGIRNAELKTAEPTAPIPESQTRISIPHSEFRIPNWRIPQCSLVVALEDPIDKVVVPRLKAAGADLAKVAFLACVKETGPDDACVAQLQLPRDLGLIHAECVAHRPAVLVIDPFFAVLGYDEEGHFIKASDDQSVRRLTSRLKTLAEELDITIVLVRHLNKASGGTAVKRGSGSIAIGGQARAVMLVARDPTDPDSRVLAMIKNNFAPTPSSLLFQVVDDGEAGRIEWRGASDLLADNLIQSKQAGQARDEALQDAMFFLRHTLGHTMQPWEKLVQLGKEEGHSEGTMLRARRTIKLRKQFVGESKIVWGLPLGELLSASF
jgi:hypothetical protein